MTIIKQTSPRNSSMNVDIALNPVREDSVIKNVNGHILPIIQTEAMTNIEKWKPINGYEEFYEISNLRKIKSKAKLQRHSKNNFYLTKDKILKHNKGKRGYFTIALTKLGKAKTLMVHRLFAQAFIPNPENKPFINHINGIKTDNRIDNLEWCTSSENIKHSFDNGLHISVKGENSGRSKLTEIQVIEIIKSNLSPSDLSKNYNISQTQILNIKNRISWTHIKI